MFFLLICSRKLNMAEQEGLVQSFMWHYKCTFTNPPLNRARTQFQNRKIHTKYTQSETQEHVRSQDWQLGLQDNKIDFVPGLLSLMSKLLFVP